MKPKVIIYAAVSLDGRTTGFPVDLGLFYSLVQQWDEDATLVGSNTFLEAEDQIPENGETPDESDLSGAPDDAGKERRPLLVVPDSRGRIRNWHCWKRQPYWRDPVALCTEQTPPEHLEYLRAEGINVLMAGTDHVDLGQALESLNRDYGVAVVRVDSGGTLNGVLFKDGLVDELHLLVHPALVGANSRKTFFVDQPAGSEDMIPLRLLDSKLLGEGIMMLSYAVIR